MKKVNNCKIDRYYYTDTREDTRYLVWFVDIVESDNMGTTEDMFEAFIAPRDHYTSYGTTKYMFGMPKKQPNGCDIDLDGFLECVEASIEKEIDWWYKDSIEEV